MEGANQHHDQPLVGAGGEGHVSHSAMLNHAESTARIKEILESNSGGFQAMSGQVQIQSTVDSEDTPRDDDDMSDNEGSQQTNLFAAKSTRCPMWLLHHIKSADFDERIQQGERSDTPEMLVNETTVDGKGQCFILTWATCGK